MGRRGNLKTGTVKFYSSQRGFGFIISDAGGSDVWFHIRNVQGGQGRPGEGDAVLFEGDRVLYEAVEAEQGLKAIRVIRACEAEGVCPTCGHWFEG